MRRVFADTNYYLALFGPRDQYHPAAVAWSQQPNLTFVTSEFVLVEVGNALTRGRDRELFVGLEQTLRADADTELVAASPDLFAQGLALFVRRPDKTWSLTDCTSFETMTRRGLTEALTADQHFLQAGFRALLLEPPDSN